ncbi:TonB-dependent receptor [Tenacibaculum agarivorans]|uniref:TonB-dependent receptor n=1 Tax=Tenacibaculum agarivorans TaxID=1908389 RepID=UPI00094B95F2|nr:carboxypeptidase regulatory-like domain-containing protein [Tenacibaculum agarivorans]
MNNFKNALIVALLFVVTTVLGQGVTSSSVSGKITDNNGEPLPGANVLLVHTPSGTKYGASTDFDGFFRISNMRVGGPYKVNISFVGFQTVETDGIFLSLGQTKKINLSLSEESNQLEEVVINAQRDGLIDGNKTGSETTIGKREIATLASASRSIADFVRLTPQAQISEDDDGFSISIGGQNNRYNSIYIDGAVNNDVFGLADSGTNGGQTGVSPFSIDAIEQFQVNIAPFDVKQAGFTGGAINAITRSGTNNFEGSAYFFTRNENLAGKTPVDLVGANGRQKLGEFTANTYGVRIGGPIIEDKLFFFVNYEKQDEEQPQPFAIENYSGDATAADIARLSDHVFNTYGYDIGNFENALRTLESDKLTAKIDWNIDDKNKLLLKHTFVRAENLETRGSDNNELGFSNGSEFFNSNTNSSSLEWSYQGNKIANNLLLGYTRVRDDRDPNGNPFPSVTINDGTGGSSFSGLRFGAERFSTANLLNTDVFTITNNFEIYYGAHTFTIGTHNEFTDVKNLFFASNYGLYVYDTIDDFINNTNLQDFERSYSLVSNSFGDDSSGAAEFGTKQFGFYLQDAVDFTENLKITAGLRFDVPVWEDGTVNDDFNTRTIPLLQAAGKDLKGARVGQGVNTRLYISPRLGFNWDVNGNAKTQVRGGMGIFVSRLPLVWPGATYNNNGVTAAERDDATGLTFNPNVGTQPVGVAPGSGFTGGAIDLFTPDFQLPQVIKYNIAVDRKLPKGFSVSADFVYNDNLSAIFYENLNIGNALGNLAGADNRPFYSRSRIDGTYTSVILASNTNVGSSWNTSFTARNTFKSELIDVYSTATYSFGESSSIFDGTSSRNISQWRGIVTVNGKNGNPQLGRSGFAQGHRVLANVSADFKWNENFKTTVGLFYNGNQGNPFSYVYGGDGILGDDSRDNALVYIPSDASEINLVDFVDNGTTVTAADQWTALNTFIENDEYLRSRRGQYVERNGDRARWSHVVDLKLLQDFKLKAFGKTHTLQLSADIFNFTNLLNKEWGKTFFASDFRLIDVANGSGTANPEFNFDPGTRVIDQVDDRGIQSSRWQAQIGLRYIFD